MLKLIILLVAIPALTPVALNTLLPDAQKQALNSWLVSNDLRSVSKILLGDGNVKTAEDPQSLLEITTDKNTYSDNWDALKSAAAQAHTAITDGKASEALNSDMFGDIFSDAANHSGVDAKAVQSSMNEWFPEVQFEESIPSHQISGNGCMTQDGTVKISSDEC